MVVDQNSCIHKRPFFANKHVTFTKLSRTPCYLSRGRCWATTPLMKIHSPPAKLRQLENHGSLLDSLVNMQLSSRNPFSGQIVAD